MIVPGGSKTWRISSYSQEGNDCVEVAFDENEVAVRDTKDRDGGQFAVPAAAWQAAIDRLRPA